MEIGKSVVLNVSRGLYALANGLAGFTEAISTEFFVIHTRDFDVDVDAVEQGAGDAFLVFGDDSRGAGAGFLRVSIESTWTGVYTSAHSFLI